MAAFDPTQDRQTINVSFSDFERLEQNLFISNKLLELSERGVFVNHHIDLFSILSLLISDSISIMKHSDY
ncbi:hypothetical protein [Serratia sp. JSRIV006]|uniref:hypothetical protein n=1 Tax=Serratia sp. JSRIV006 TaxID=2831896 RepID=UPI001CBF6DE5|nr:hypothetical protein [Serratia sp. JSRIV006]UAN65795.1 hypothetical protein KGP16_27080 [Serratia sp. JSRIV006]